MFESRSAHYTSSQERAFAVLRIFFGLIWVANTLLEANTSYVARFWGSIIRRMNGQPNFVQYYLRTVIHGIWILGPHNVAIATVVLNGLLALSLITGIALRPFARIGIFYNLFLWSTVGGFGGPYTVGATDPGTAIVYALVFFTVLAVPSERRLSLSRTPTPSIDARDMEVVRILFGLLWLFDAFWKWHPGFFEHSLSYLRSSEVGQPTWIVVYIGFFVQVLSAIGGVIFGIFAAIIETVLGLSLLIKRGFDWFLPIGLLYSFGVWTTAEGWGGPYVLGSTGNRGDVLGTANIYMVVYLYLIVAYLIDRRQHHQR